jgi:hypothetical protein
MHDVPAMEYHVACTDTSVRRCKIWVHPIKLTNTIQSVTNIPVQECYILFLSN